MRVLEGGGAVKFGGKRVVKCGTPDCHLLPRTQDPRQQQHQQPQQQQQQQQPQQQLQQQQPPLLLLLLQPQQRRPPRIMEEGKIGPTILTTSTGDLAEILITLYFYLVTF